MTTSTADEMTVAEAAALLKLSDRAVVKAVKRGEIDARTTWSGLRPQYHLARSSVEAAAQRRGITTEGT